MIKIAKNTKPQRLVRLRPGFNLVGDSPSKGYANIENGLLPRPIKRGRASYLTEFEIEAIIAARAARWSDDAIKDLVKALHEARANGLSELGITIEQAVCA